MVLSNSDDSDADEFYDALDHLEEEEESACCSTSATAANEVPAAAVASGEIDDEPAPGRLLIKSSDASTTQHTAEPCMSVDHRERSEESGETTALSTTKKSSLDTQVKYESEIIDLLKTQRSVSLFDALSGSGSEELENVEMKTYALPSNSDRSGEMNTCVVEETQSSHEGEKEEEEHGEQSIDKEMAVYPMDAEFEKTMDNESNSVGLKLNAYDDTANANNGVVSTENEEDQASSEESMVENHDGEGDDAQLGVKRVVSEEDQDRNTDVQDKTSTTESSSFDTTIKEEFQQLKLDLEQSNADEYRENLTEEEEKMDEKNTYEEVITDNTEQVAPPSPDVVQEQVVTDGDYITPRKIDCGEMCDIGSPLETLFLYCQGGRRSGLDIDVEEEGFEVPLRTSNAVEADPKVPAPLSPVDPDEHDYDFESSSDDSSIESFEDTERIHRDIDNKGSNDDVDLLPDRLIATASYDQSVPPSPDHSQSSSPTVSPMRKASEKLKRGVAGLTSNKRNHHRKRLQPREELPSNAVFVRTSREKTSQLRIKSSSSEETATRHASDSSFNPMLLVKTLPIHDGSAWCASFSQDGRFLSTGGEDGNVTIWAVAPKSKALHPNGPAARGDDDNNSNTKVDEDPPLSFIGLGPELATNLEIIDSQPVQRYTDHTADVIDLSWSHSCFLLSASVDNSVRLYHHSKSSCLHLFKHANLVASVDFHPSDDRYFISGGLDKKLRLWNITDGRVKDWAQAPEVITATRFTPDGKYAVCGLLRGQVYLYETDDKGLKYYTQVACRNRSGKNSKGKKVTGISFLRERDDLSERSEMHPSLSERLSETGSRVMNLVSTKVLGHQEAMSARRTDRMLVTTNDSRVRLYGLNDFCLIRKYKGHINNSMQIRARLSESGSHISCGSESGHCFIWDVDPIKTTRQKKHAINKQIQSTKDKTKSTYYFEATKATLPVVTDTLFFPSKTVRESLLTSEEVFPLSLGMDRIEDDLSTAIMLTLDYDGKMRIFVRKTCIDNILEACTPRGGTMA